MVVNEKSVARRVLQPIRMLKDCDHLGEIGLIYDCPRTMQAQAKRYCILASMSKSNLDTMAIQYPVMVAQFKRHIAFYNDDVKRTLEIALPRTPLFQTMSVDELLRVIFVFRMITVPPG